MKSILMMLLLTMTAASHAQSDAEEIKEVFRKYRIAVLKSNGSDAIACVDSGSIKMYNTLLNKSLKLNRKQFFKENTLDQIMISQVRMDLSKDKLLKMTGRDLFIYSVDNDFSSKSAIEDINALANITVQGDVARAGIVQMPELQTFVFVLEKGEWKLSLSKLEELGKVHIEKLQSQLRMTDEEFLKEIFKSTLKKDWNDKVPDGPIK